MSFSAFNAGILGTSRLVYALGRENISHLYLDGVVETYGSEKDQIVLDAIARLLWS